MMIQNKLLRRCLYRFTLILLGASPFIAALTSAQQISISPLPQSLTAEALAIPARQTTDPRATALADRLTQALQQLKQAQSVATVQVTSPRIMVAGGGSVTSSRKRAATQSAGKVAPSTTTKISVPASRFTSKMRPGGSIRGVTALANEVLQSALGSTPGDDEATVRTFLRAQRALLGLADPDKELNLRKRLTDELGHRHLRFSQNFQGLPVWGAELIAQLDEAGNLITLNGAYAPTPRKLITQPIVDEAQAVNTARTLHQAADYSDPALVVFLKDGVTPRLAWEMELTVGVLDKRLILVDAHDGTVLMDLNQVQSGNVVGSGIDLYGNLQTVNVWEEGGIHYIVDTTKPMFNPTMPPLPVDLSGGTIVVADFANEPEETGNPSIVLSNVGANGPWLMDGVSAAVNLSNTYDYFFARHGRNSLDDQGNTVIALVRIGQDLQNAYFDGRFLFFGDGDRWAGSLDVVAHEFTHGVVFNSANLKYQNQSGALNEAFADIFGEMVEAHVFGQPDWLFGTGLTAPSRSLANPELFGQPSRMSNFVQTSSDDGGVHINSGIINHAFYLLAVGLPNAIGIDDAARIFYRALTTKLVRLSEFIDARLDAIQSAEELFGVSSIQAQLTIEAFDAVEIFDTPVNPQPPPYPGSNGQDATLFIYWDPSAGANFLGRYEPSLGDVAPGIKLSLNPVAVTRPSVSGNGTFAVFVDAQQDVCLINTGVQFSETCLGMPGTVSSVAMAPDGETFGFVFLDALGNPDNTISVIDVVTSQSQTLALVSPVYDGTTSVEVLQADAMDFTADSRFIIYDAFNALSFSDGSSLGLWSIYAIDLLTGGTLSLIPPTVGLDIGFPALAQTSDGHLTFDVFDNSVSQNFVLAGNIYTGSRSVIATTSEFSVPSFTGDDSAIVYSASDPGVPTLFSLIHQPVLADRITPTGATTTWLTDADYGAVYRRGNFTAPIRVDLTVTQSVTTQASHRATFQIQITNQGPDMATNLRVIDTLPAGVSVVATTGNCSIAAGQVQCSIDNIPANTTATIDVEVQALVFAALTNAVTAFASEPDMNASDNTAFATVDAAALNIAPVVANAGVDQQARVGTAFSLNVSTNFDDADNDALTFSASGLPASLSINAATGVISGTPAAAEVSSTAYAVQVTAADIAGATASILFDVTVNAAPAPAPPVASSGGGGGSVDLLTLFYLLVGCAVGIRTSRRRLTTKRYRI